MSESGEDRAYQLGIVSGWEEAAEHIRNLSGERWMAGAHKDAKTRWDLYLVLDSQAKVLRKDYDSRRAKE